ncbi:hypothetical protein BJV78DRAFT_945165 [Lactifluus subvellereus]|nr:hypothetical protein BJV78DRAFT_945165 [Lactifluus subvellereus]
MYVSADTSLFIPGFDPQPLSVENLGTDGQGRTTWEILPGTPTGISDEVAFVGTATLVEGPNDAHLAYNNAQMSVTLDIQCGINNGIAACTGDAGYDVTPFIFPTAPARPFLVQGGGGPVSASTSSQSSALPSPSPASSAPSALSPAASSKSANNASSNLVVQIYLGLLCATGVVALVLL